MRIIIVEAELIIAEDLRMSLEERGYEVIGTVSTPEKAFTESRDKLPDLILMDVYLGSKYDDSIAIGRAIKEQLGIPVVYMKACRKMPSSRTVQSQEQELCVTKPFSQDELYAVIETALMSRGRSS